MPRKPGTPCHHPGCPRLCDSYYCKEHALLHKNDRPGSSQRGYNSKWSRRRKQYLREHPFCVRCFAKGIATEATVVDHIVPHRGDPVLFWDESNWQSLCKPCHDEKTWNEDARPVYHY